MSDVIANNSKPSTLISTGIEMIAAKAGTAPPAILHSACLVIIGLISLNQNKNSRLANANTARSTLALLASRIIDKSLNRLKGSLYVNMLQTLFK